MKLRPLDGCLLLAIAIGGYFAVRTGRERSRLDRHVQRLIRKAGDLPIGDASQVHLRALATGEPLHYAWRAHWPSNYTQTIKTQSGGQATYWSSSPSTFIARVRFREDEQGNLEVYTNFSGGSTRSGIGDQALATFLRGRWDKILVEQVGAADVVALERDRGAVVLRLTLPQDMQAEARATLPREVQERLIPFFFQVELGPEP